MRMESALGQVGRKLGASVEAIPYGTGGGPVFSREREPSRRHLVTHCIWQDIPKKPFGTDEACGAVPFEVLAVSRRRGRK
jgi:hypothetical protein